MRGPAWRPVGACALHRGYKGLYKGCQRYCVLASLLGVLRALEGRVRGSTGIYRGCEGLTWV